MHINFSLKNCKKNAFKIDKLCKNIHFEMRLLNRIVPIKTKQYIGIPRKMEFF